LNGFFKSFPVFLIIDSTFESSFLGAGLVVAGVVDVAFLLGGGAAGDADRATGDAG
jgi:hypothetical protein